MSGFKEFVKKEFIVIIAGTAALVSCALVPVTDYSKFIDTNVLGILFSLMLIIAGLRGNNLLSKLSGWIVRKTHVEGTRKAFTVMALLTFFVSMFVTNDAALIALVPITVGFFADYPVHMIYAIVAQTVAANLGSMATPFGNPQNLLIYTTYDITPFEFFKAAAPTAFLGFGAVILLCLFIKDEPLVPDDERDTKLTNKPYLVLYGMLFVLVMLTVFGVLDVLVVFASACVVVIIIEPKRFLQIDYGLLVSFIFFFVFVGNIQRIGSVNDLITSLVNGKEFFASVLSSQVISNVPAALMLTGFTDNWKAVMLGTDIGGLGTPVASLASLISIRIYGETENAKPLKFLGVFTLVNFAVLAVMYIFAILTQL